MRNYGVLAAVVLTLLISTTLAAESWPRFRGPNGDGISTSRGLPESLGLETNLRWRIELQAGTSSPIVNGERLFITTFSGNERSLHCLEAASGKELWKQTVKALREESFTPPNNPATCTPVCEGDEICVLFPDAGLYCFSTAGRLIWNKDLGPFYTMHGISSSLIVADGKVVVSADQLKDSFLAAYDIKDGREMWKIERPIGVTGGYSTPALFRGPDGAAQVVSAGSLELAGYDLATGSRLWWAEGLTNAPIGLPVIANGRVFVCEPASDEPLSMQLMGDVDKNKDGKIAFDEVRDSTAGFRLIERIDRAYGNSDGFVDQAEWDKAFGSFVHRGGLACVEMGGKGNVTSSHVRWHYTKPTPSIPSVVIVDDVLYAVNDGGILLSFDAQTGELLKRDRLRGATAQYYASPVAADGKLFLVDTSGKVTVVKAGRPWEILATNDLGEPAHASPAICNGRLFFRTQKSLFCFGKS